MVGKQIISTGTNGTGSVVNATGGIKVSKNGTLVGNFEAINFTTHQRNYIAAQQIKDGACNLYLMNEISLPNQAPAAAAIDSIGGLNGTYGGNIVNGSPPITCDNTYSTWLNSGYMTVPFRNPPINTVSYQYWQFVLNSNSPNNINTSGNVDLSEIYFNDGFANAYTRNGTASVPVAPYGVNNAASNAFDGNTSTFFEAYSGGQNVVLQYVFPSAIACGWIGFFCRNDIVEGPGTITIQASNDGVNYTVLNKVYPAAWQSGVQQGFYVAPNPSWSFEFFCQIISITSSNRICANSHTDTANTGLQIFARTGNPPFLDVAFNGVRAADLNNITGTPILGEIYHFAVTYDGYSNLSFYVNGALTQKWTSAIGVCAGDNNFSLGYNPSYSGDYTPGYYSNLAFYKTCLTPHQISSHYNANYNTGFLIENQIELLPNQLNFNYSPQFLLSNYFQPQSTLMDFTDTFTTTLNFTRYSETGTFGSFSVASNVATVYHSIAANDIFVESSSTYSIPQMFVAIDVIAHPIANETGYANVGVGIAKDGNNFLFCVYQFSGNQVGIEVKIAGSVTFVTNVTYSTSLPFSLGMSLINNSVVGWIKPGGSSSSSTWQQITGTTAINSYYNFSTVGNLSGWGAAFTYATAGGTGSMQFANFKSGRFGYTGLREYTLVTNQNGTPYFPSNNTILFTAICNDSNGAFYQGLFQATLPTTTSQSQSLTQIGVIYNQRGGYLQNDLDISIIYYPNGNRYLTLTTWGIASTNQTTSTITVQGVLITSGPDILTSPITILSGTAQLNLPLNGNSGCGVSQLIYDSSVSLYRICYSITTSGGSYYTSMATSPDLVTWTLVFSDTSQQNYIPRFFTNNNQYYISTTNNSNYIFYNGSITNIQKTYTYWKFYFTLSTVGTGYIALSEIQFYLSGTQITLTGGIVTASSSYNASTNPASNMFDSNQSTWWTGRVDDTNSSVVYQFPLSTAVDEIIFYSRTDDAYQGPATITIQGSNDGINYTNLANYTANTWASGVPQPVYFYNAGTISGGDRAVNIITVGNYDWLLSCNSNYYKNSISFGEPYFKYSNRYPTSNSISPAGLFNTTNTLNVYPVLKSQGTLGINNIMVQNYASYDLDFFVSGIPGSYQQVIRYNIVRPIYFNSQFNPSVATCGTTPTSTSTFTININGGVLGYIQFNPGNYNAVFYVNSSGLLYFNVGDILTINAPFNQDATLANVSISLCGYSGAR